MFFYGLDAIQITAVAATLAAILIVVGLFVYNHAAGLQVKTLKSIDEKLTDRSAEKAETAESIEKAEMTGSEQPEEKSADVKCKNTADMFYNVGRSGRTYTKEELEVQIKE